MRSLLKWLGLFVLMGLPVGAGAVAWNWQRLQRLYHVITLFDEERIVTNFSHMDTLFPTAPIRRAGPVLPFREVPRELPETYVFAGETRRISEFLDRTATTSFLVLRNGEIVYESYRLGTRPDDLRISWSVAKSFLSALFGVAVAEGKIGSIDDPVTDYVPLLQGSAYDGVAIVDVLNMASGVKFDEDYMDFNSDINRMGRTLALGGSLDAFAAAVDERLRAPGISRRYASTDTHVLGMVLRAATGKSAADYMAEKLWSKLGVEADAYYLADGHGVAFVLAGLNMRTRDFARFGQLFLNEGVSSGQQIVPSEWVRISVRPTAPAPDYPGDPFGYGYQWWVPPEPDGEFFAVGVYDQYIYVNRPAGVVIVKTAANRKFRDDGAYGNVVQLENITVFRAIVAGVAD